MAEFGGVRDFMAALTGGGQAQANSYDATTARLLRQRSSQTSLDRQLEQLVRDKDINRNRDELDATIDDPLIRALTLGGTGVGANFSGAQSGKQTGIENEALQAALTALKGSQTVGEEIPVDLINALTGVRSGKLLAPTNVQVQDQAASDIRSSDAVAALNEGKLSDLLPAQVDAATALAALNEGKLSDLLPAQVDAATALAEQRRTRTTTGEGSFNLENPTKEQLSLLFEEISPEIPAEKGFLGIGGTDAVPAEFKDLFPEFMEFQAQNALTDPRMQDSTYAITKFLQSRVAGAAPPTAAAEAPAPVIPTNIAPDDVDAIMAKANDLIANGADPEAVRKRLAEMGITVQ